MGPSWWGRLFVGFCLGWGLVSSLCVWRQLFLFGALVLCGGAVVCRGCRSLHVGCQLFAGLTKVIAWGRLSTV